MAQNDWDDDLDTEDDGSPLVKKLRAQLKAQAKAVAERDEKLNSLSKKVRQTEVKEILKESGVNPKVARFVLADVEDVTKESVAEWVAENGELFGISQGEPAEEEAKAAPVGMTPDEAIALSQINQFSTPDASGVNPQLADMAQRIAATQNADELTALTGTNKVTAF